MSYLYGKAYRSKAMPYLYGKAMSYRHADEVGTVSGAEVVASAGLGIANPARCQLAGPTGW